MIAEPLFASIKARLIFWALCLVAVMFVSLGIKLYLTSSDLDEAVKNIDLLRGQKATLQSDLDSVTADLQGSEKEVERLHKEVQLTATSLADREASRRQVESLKSSDKANVMRIIEHANTQARAFADAAMPDDFASVLKRASHCANNNDAPDGVCTAAGRTALPLPDP